ncbi:hypothetical protein KI387_018842, partial [Taxus chinensis]
LLQATHDELKKADHVLTICTTPKSADHGENLGGRNEVHKVMKSHTECLSLVKQKREALVAAQAPHKERLEELGKLISQRMDVLEGVQTSMSSIMLVIQNEKGELSMEELQSIIADVPKTTGVALIAWENLE